MKLHIVKIGQNRIQLDKQDDNGNLLCRFAATFSSGDHFKKASKELNLPIEQVTRYVDKFEKTDQLTPIIFNLQKYECDNFKLSIRGIAALESTAETIQHESPYEAFKLALNHLTLATNPLIYWTDKTYLAAVDLDIKSKAYNDDDLIKLLFTLQPRPSFSWITHGGGIRLVYVAQENFSAEELAALAILTLSQTLTYDNIELKSTTRHPKYENEKHQTAGDVKVTPQSIEAPLVLKLLHKFSILDSDVKEWLDSKGYEVGKRYSHAECPVNPTDTVKTDCVLIGDYGIKCYACESHGIKYGSNTAGFFPYGSFVGTNEASLLYRCIKNYTHYTHIKYILQAKFGFTEGINQVVYRALIKLVHDVPDDFINDIMFKGNNLIRLEKRWTNLWGEEYIKDLKTILSTIPACKYVKSNGEIQLDEEKLGILQQSHDLMEYGYPSLKPIWGCKIGTHYIRNDTSEKYRAVIHRPIFRGQDAKNFAPKYVETYDVIRAWNVLETVFPKINRRLVTLLIAARGCMELESGLPPFIFISGPTSSGKSAVINVAAGIIGDKTTSIVWTNNVERARQGVQTAKENGSYVVFNEVVKESEHKKQTPTAALDFLLNLTPESSSHKLYIGATELGQLPVTVFTDNEFPFEIRADKQLARRMIHVQLTDTVDWVKPIVDHNLSSIECIRLLGKDYAEACNAILSFTIDMFFQERQSFMDIAELLGYKSLVDSDEQLDMNTQLREFFHLVCKAPIPTGADKTRWSGRGWKVINRVDKEKSELVGMWLSICDGENEEGFIKSRRCIEVDWGKLLDLKESCLCEIKAHGISKIAVRFKNAKGTKQDYLVNEELLK